MQAKITRTMGNIDEKLQLQAQGVIYDDVTLLNPEGMIALPHQGQNAILLAKNTGDNLLAGGYFALPVGAIDALPGSAKNIRTDETHLVASSGAQIILASDGSIILKPASGKYVYIETVQGKKRILQDGDSINIAGSTPASGVVTLNPAAA